MKPFNLEQAIAGKPVVTRDGKLVTEIHLLKTTEEKVYPLLAVIDGHTRWFTIEGSYVKFSETNIDLFMADEKKTVWIGVNKDNISGRYPTSSAYESKERLENGYNGEDWQIISVEIEV